MIKLIKLLTFGDRILLTILLSIIVFSAVVINIRNTQGNNIRISVNNQLIRTVAIDHDQSIKIDGYDGPIKIEIFNHKVWVAKSSCPHQFCMKTGKVQHSGDLIICIPNKLLVEVKGIDKPKLDGITM